MITSNISSVIRRLERYQAELPGVVARVMVPEKYLTHLEVTATRTLKALADSKEELALVPKFVATIRAQANEGGMLFSMRSPQEGLSVDVEGARQAVEQSRSRVHGDEVSTRKAPLAMPLAAEQNVLTVRDAVLKWVREEKRKDERDADRTDEEIADRLIWIMGLHADQSFTVRNTDEVFDVDPDTRTISYVQSKSYTDEMRVAGAGLARSVQEWVDTGGLAATAAGSAQLKFDALQATQWLAAVLAAWRSALRDRLRLALEREFAALKHRLKSELL